MTFDTTIHLSDLVLFGGGILAFGRVWLAMRDDIRDHSKDIKRIDDTVKEHDVAILRHETVLNRRWFSRADDQEPT